MLRLAGKTQEIHDLGIAIGHREADRTIAILEHDSILDEHRKSPSTLLEDISMERDR